jgi:hypothetical protein
VDAQSIGYIHAECSGFGVKNSVATRAAERFFKERRVTIHLVDFEAEADVRGGN